MVTDYYLVWAQLSLQDGWHADGDPGVLKQDPGEIIGHSYCLLQLKAWVRIATKRLRPQKPEGSAELGRT